MSSKASGIQRAVIMAYAMPLAALGLLAVSAHLFPTLFFAGLALYFICSLCAGVVFARKVADPLARLEKAVRQAWSDLKPLSVDGCSPTIELLKEQFDSLLALLSDATKRESQALDAIGEGVFLADENLIVTQANSAARTLIASQQLVGKSLTQVAPYQSTGQLEEFFRNIKRLECADSLEVPLGDPLSLTTRYVALFAQWSRRNCQFVCVVYEITDQKHNERLIAENDRQMRLMLDKIPASLVVVDLSGQVVAANEAARRVLSVDGGDVVGQGIGALLPLPTSVSESDWLNGRLDAPPVVLGMKRHDRPLHLEVRVIAINLRRQQNFLLLITEVTATQQLEALRNALLRSIAQHICIPLNAVSNLFSRIQASSSNLSKEARQHLHSAEEETNRLLRLFSEFLEVAYSNVRQLTLHKREVSTQQVVQQALSTAYLTAQKKNIALSSSVPDIRFYADPERIVQVIVNLVFNALKFTDSGGSVQVEAEVTGPNTLELRVVDTGRGIRPGMEEAIFEPFKQTSAEDSVRKGGFGLGLFICRNIIERHGGRIVARNRQQGAAFCIVLPVDDLTAQRLADYERQRLANASARRDFEEKNLALQTQLGLSKTRMRMLEVAASNTRDRREFEQIDAKLNPVFQQSVQHSNIKQRMDEIISSAPTRQGGALNEQGGAPPYHTANSSPAMSLNDKQFAGRKTYGWSALSTSVIELFNRRRGGLAPAAIADDPSFLRDRTYKEHEIGKIETRLQASPRGRKRSRSTLIVSACLFLATLCIGLRLLIKPEEGERKQQPVVAATEPAPPTKPFQLPPADYSPPPAATTTAPASAPVQSTPPGQAGVVADADSESVELIKARHYYEAELDKQPDNIHLCIEGVQTLRRLKDFATARSLCQKGLLHAKNQQDYLALLDLLSSLPR